MKTIQDFISDYVNNAGHFDDDYPVIGIKMVMKIMEEYAAQSPIPNSPNDPPPHTEYVIVQVNGVTIRMPHVYHFDKWWPLLGDQPTENVTGWFEYPEL